MKQYLLAFGLIILIPVSATAQSVHSNSEKPFPGLQSNTVRAQLVPLKKGIFSAGIGAIVENIAVQEGDVVETGDLLLAFDCDDLEASRKQAQAHLDSARATLKVNRELVKLNSVGPLEVKLNEAEVNVALGEIDLAMAKLKHCEIRAPFPGAITMRAVEQYQFVEEGQEMLELVSRDELEVRMLLPSTSLAWLSHGSQFTMLVEELNRVIRGSIVRIGGAVDPVSLTIPVFGTLDEQQSTLLPGMSGRVEFETTGSE